MISVETQFHGFKCWNVNHIMFHHVTPDIPLLAGTISVGYNMSNITVEESVGSVELCAVITSGDGLRPFNLTVNTIKMTAGYQFTINLAITLVAFL